MRLRNKKTGEIVEICKICPEPYEARDFDCSSLAELNEEWEDYEDRKSYYYITSIGETVFRGFALKSWNGGDERRKEIGNYFETKEEAEKAVEKLKALKRLKDKGICFYGWRRNQTGTIDLLVKWEGVPPLTGFIEKDLDLLFGGEE